MNENNNLSYYPENITIKDGKVTTESLNNSQNENIGKNSNTQNKSPNTPPLNLLMSLIGNNKNMTDILPILLAKNANFNSEQLTSLMKNFQKNTPTKNSTSETKKFHKTNIEEMWVKILNLKQKK